MLTSSDLYFDLRRQAVERLAENRAIANMDVEALRRDVFADGSVTRAEADALFALERAEAPKCGAWTPFFVEAITDHVVWQVRPTGIVSAAQGEWLLEQADAARTLNSFATLINVLSEAHRVPLWFVAAVRARAARGWPGADVAMAAASAELMAAA